MSEKEETPVTEYIMVAYWEVDKYLALGWRLYGSPVCVAELTHEHGIVHTVQQAMVK